MLTEVTAEDTDVEMNDHGQRQAPSRAGVHKGVPRPLGRGSSRRKGRAVTAATFLN